MATVAEVLVETLVRAGVKRVLGIVGNSLNGITEIAIRTSIGHNAVSVIVISGDTATKKAETKKPRVRIHKPATATRPSDEEIDALAKALNDPTGITILGAAGCAGATPEIKESKERLNGEVAIADEPPRNRNMRSSRFWDREPLNARSALRK
jgi:thiamine pyrophosphate-dependent acetolactate synthase large subunit-like protein